MSYKYYLGPEIGTYMYGNKQTLHKMYYVKILLIFNLFDVGNQKLTDISSACFSFSNHIHM